MIGVPNARSPEPLRRKQARAAKLPSRAEKSEVSCAAPCCTPCSIMQHDAAFCESAFGNISARKVQRTRPAPISRRCCKSELMHCPGIHTGLPLRAAFFMCMVASMQVMKAAAGQAQSGIESRPLLNFIILAHSS